MNKRATQLRKKAATRAIPARSGLARLLAEALEPRMLLTAAVSWGPAHLAIAPDSAVWHAQEDTLTRHAPDGTLQTYSVPRAPNGAARPVVSDIVFTADASAWFLINDPLGRKIERLSPQGQFAEVLSVAPGNIHDLAVAADGNLWFARDANTLGTLGTNGARGQALQVTGLAGFSGLTTGPDGAVWFAGSGADGRGIVGSLDARFLLTYRLDGQPLSIATGSDGHLYLGGNDALWKVSSTGTITRQAYAGTTSLSLATAPDGAVWFIDARNPLNPIGRVSPNGTLSQMAIPGGAGTRLEALVIGNDGIAWYAGRKADGTVLVGQIDTTQEIHGRVQMLYVQHLQGLAGKVASFDDPLNTLANRYSATIEWGDGTSASATVIRNSQGGFDVVAGHAYASLGWQTVQVRIVDTQDASRNLTLHTAAYVTLPPVTAQGMALTLRAGEEFRGAVATFAGINPQALAQLRATIDWGGGQTEPGHLVATTTGQVLVAGVHTYASGGSRSVQVRLEAAGQSLPGYWENAQAAPFAGVTSQVAVAAGIMTGTLMPGLYPVNGTHFAGTLARFAYGGNATTLRARVDWGDGQALSDGTILPVAGGFVVGGYHQYVQPSAKTARVLIFDASGKQLGLAQGAIEVVPHLSTTLRRIQAVAGTEFQGVVADLQVQGYGAWQAGYQASIAWGDGTTSPGQLTSLGNGRYQVTGRHTYATGSATLSPRVTIVEKRQSFNGLEQYAYTSSATGTAFIGAAPVNGFDLHHVGAFWNAVTAGHPAVMTLGAITLAYDAGSIQGNVTWDDGTVSTATLSAAPGLSPWTLVNTARSFNQPGRYTGVLRLTTGAKTVEVPVAQDVTLAQTVSTVQLGRLDVQGADFTLGSAWNGVVAKFQPDASVNVEALSATIYWGDGTTSAGQIRPAPGGGYEIVGGHTYTRLGQPNPNADGTLFRFDVTLESAHASQQGASINRVRSAGSSTLAPLSAAAVLQREEFTAFLGLYTPPENVDLSSLGATINWGDGATTAAQLVPWADGKYLLRGTHAFDAQGSHEVLVSVSSPQGTATTRVDLTVLHNPILITPGSLLTVTGTTVQGRVGSFTDLEPALPGASTAYIYNALIDWGDGTASMGTLVPAENGGFDVIGSHTYAQEGDYSLQLTVRCVAQSLPKIVVPQVTILAVDTFGNDLGTTGQGPGGLVTPGWHPPPMGEISRRLGTLRIGAGMPDNPGGEDNPDSTTLLVAAPHEQPPAAEPATHETAAEVELVQTDAGATPPSSSPITDLGYALVPDAQDPGVFQGEFGVVLGPPAPRERQHEAGEPADPYAASPTVTDATPVATVPRGGETHTAVPRRLADDGASELPELPPTYITVATAISGRTVESQQPDQASTVTEADAMHLITMAETPLPPAGGRSWWKVIAVVCAGALVQTWCWQKVIRARRRWI